MPKYYTMPTHLSEQEIDRAVRRIRSEYDHYIVHFHKTIEVKRKFEDRYAEALRNRTDLTLFLGAEMQVVKTLLQRAEEEASKPPAPPSPGPAKKKSYADLIVEQLRARIREYPALGLPDHPEKSPDVDKLYGTLRWFRKELWDHLYPIFLGKCPSPGLFAADTDLGALTLQGDKWPKEIETYWALLNGNAELNQVARAQNRCLLLGGQLLQRISRVLDGAKACPDLNAQELKVVEKASSLVERILKDFRLKELVARS